MMRSLVLWLLLSGTALAQATVPAGTANFADPGQPYAPKSSALGTTNVTRIIQARGVSVAIPAIAAQTISPVTVTVSATIAGTSYAPQVGDVIKASMASGSTAIPASVMSDGMITCSTAGQVTFRFVNENTVTASAATTITVNVEWSGP